MSTKKVLVAGATGKLGNKIVKALIDHGAEVTAMVRATSNRTKLEGMGVKNFVVGDMMDKASLKEAISPKHGFDVIVASAAGYTRHSKGDNPATDTTGYHNLVDATKDAGIPRFVLISILECDRALEVPHFHNKYLTEKYLAGKQQPFIALRPGAFFDWSEEALVKKISKGVVPVFFYGSSYGAIYSPDLARYVALAATSVPDSELNTTVDVGWSEPVNGTKLAAAFEKVLGKPMKAEPAVPLFVINVVAPFLSLFSGTVRDMYKMVKWVDTGDYVSKNPERQKKLFGELPAIEEGVRRFCKDNHLL